MSGSTPVARSRTLSADDWVAAALQALAEGGIGAVAVEPLAQRLGVTKGSFYWHFANRDALLRATLGRWEEATETSIVALDRMPDPGDRLRRLASDVLTDALLVGRDAEPGTVFRRGLDLAIADAADDPIVQPTLRRVSDRRVAYIEACCRALGCAPDAARDRALLIYAASVGTLRLAREAPNRMPHGEAFTAYRDHLIATLIPEGTTRVKARD